MDPFMIKTAKGKQLQEERGMDMGTWFGPLAVLLIWVAAPFAEMGIIIYLAISNDRYKKRIKELTQQGKGQTQMGPAQAEQTQIGQDIPKTTLQSDGSGYGTRPVALRQDVEPSMVHPQGQGMAPVPQHPATASGHVPQHPAMGMAPAKVPVKTGASGRGFSERFKADIQSNLGTLALVIGVIFVAIAGVIFATTTWHTLPAAAKAFLVLGAAGLFFGASYLAEEVLHIHRTGNAFYLLGSIFLFLSCLATAYFKLLGPAFILDGIHRWRVLWVGSLVTELALFGGLKRFRDRIYTQTVLWGMTVSMCFMAKAFQADWGGLISGMMLYASLLVAWKAFLEAGTAGQTEAEQAERTAQVGTAAQVGSRELLLDGFKHFVPIHFWVFGALTVLQSLLGIGWRWFLADPLYLIGLSDGEWTAQITLLNVLAMAAFTGGIGILAWKRMDGDECGQWKLLLNGAAILSIQYTAFYIPVQETVRFFLVSAALYLWAWLGRREAYPVGSEDGAWSGRATGASFGQRDLQGGPGGWYARGGLSRFRCTGSDVICTAVLFLNVLSAFLLSLLPAEGVQDLLAASGAVLFLAATAALWGKENRALRAAIPCILWFLTITVYRLGGQVVWMGDGPAAWLFADYERLLFVFLAGLALWDMWRLDTFTLPIAAIGTLAQLIDYRIDDKTMPFALLLASCLFVRGRRMPMAEADQAQGAKIGIVQKLSSLYLLAGCYFSMCYVTSDRFFRMMAVNLCFGIWQTTSWLERRRRIVASLGAVAEDRGGAGAAESRAKAGAVAEIGLGRETKTEMWGHSLFRELCGCGAFLLTMLAFYRGLGASVKAVPWMIGLCVLTFYGYYIWFYRGEGRWYHLLAASSFLPMPYFLMDLDWIGMDQLYMGVAVVLLLSGILFRYRFPILQKEAGGGDGWRADWYHILAVFLLAAMIVDGSREWGFWYILLLALYFLQYAQVRPFKEAACFLSACLLAAAIWEQPFIRWPEVLDLELKLLPAALLVFLLRPIFGRSKTVRALQTLGYSICLSTLCLDAIRTGVLADALILEGVCLAVFIWAQVKKDILWARISGIIILLVALFMTKSFWFSISWWVYLLAAGIGLIVFAAVNEKKKH